MTIITINGKMYSGKTTTADMLASRTGITTFGMGDLIREEASEALNHHTVEGIRVLGVTEEQAGEFKRLTEGCSDVNDRTEGMRKALVLLGSDWRPEGYWVTRMLNRAYKLIEEFPVVVVSGVRRPEEHAAWKGVAVRVRLDISPEEQSRRALVRDGLVLGDEVNNFEEVALDKAEFDVRFDVDELTPTEVTAKVLRGVQTYLERKYHVPPRFRFWN